MNQTKSFKLKNPYRADQEIKQEVSISTDLIYDYSNSPWVALDTEFLSFNKLQDRLCVIQVASKETPESDTQRVELIYVYDNPETPKLNEVLQNENIEKLFHVFSADMPRIEEYTGVEIKGPIFDTKVAARIAWTNTRDHGMKQLVKMFADPNFDQSANDSFGDWEIGPENWSNTQVYYMMQDVVYLDVMRHRIMQMAERRGSLETLKHAMTSLPVINKLYKSGYTESIFGY